MQAAVLIGKAAVGIIEHMFISNGKRLCEADLPHGAPASYKYKSGNSRTHKDPRLQADTIYM